MDFLLFPGGIIGVVVVLFLYLRKQETAQRAIRSAKAHLTPLEDIETGYAAVEASMKALRAAKTEENAVHIDNWESQFYSPEEYQKVLDERRHEKMLKAGKIDSKIITSSKFFINKDTEMDMEMVVDNGVEWRPLPYSRKDPNEELSYTQRRIQSAGAFVRTEPHDQAAVYGVAEGNSVLRFDGYVRAQPIAGNDVWFFYVGKGSGLRKYVHSIATHNRNPSGLPDMTDYGDRDVTHVRNGSGEVIRTIVGPYEGSQAIQMPTAEVARRIKLDLMSRNLELH